MAFAWLFKGRSHTAEMDVKEEMLQALHEHGILDHNANAPGSPAKQDGTDVSVDLLWKLYKKVIADLETLKDVQGKEMSELEKYVTSVRGLSEERDRLTAEFDKENENLRRELNEVKEQMKQEDNEITEMCINECMTELIGKSRKEQVGYLLLLRSNLLEKLEVTEKVISKHSDLEQQLHDLRSEDHDLRNKMNTAMLEMGGMATKLNAATQERDRLKREVAYLTQTLNAVNALPAQNVNNMEAKTQIESLQHSVNYYVNQIERLTAELENCKSHNRAREAEMNSEIRELKEMNARYKDVNQELNKRVNLADSDQKSGLLTTKRSTSVDSYLLPETQERLQEQSKKLISEMQAALESDEKQAEARDQKHKEEMSRMEERVRQLEEIIRQNEEKQKQAQEAHKSEMELKQISAQLVETDRQLKVMKAESLEYQEKYHKAEREVAKAEAAWNQCQKQLNVQNDINFGLQQRNSQLEVELTKVLNQLQSANEKYNMVEIEREKLESELRQSGEQLEKMEQQMAETMRRHAEELREVERSKSPKPAIITPKPYILSESKQVSDLQIQLNQSHTDLEKEKMKRLATEENLDSARFDLESVQRKKEELAKEVDGIQQKNQSLERKLQMMSGRYEDIQGEKMVEEMSREQLEDITNVMRVRLMNALDKSFAAAEKYRSLKQKHKSKIRKIRDLFTLERMTTAEEVEKLELRVMLAESALERELAWKQDAINEVKRAEEEHRKAIKRENKAKQSADDKSHELIMALDKNKDLSAENQILQSQLAFLERQKKEIELLVKKENQKKELNTLLSSLSLSGSLPKFSTKQEAQLSGSVEVTEDDEIGNHW